MGSFFIRPTREINTIYSKKLIDWAKNHGVKKFIFASSCSVYGFSNKICSEDSRTNPLTEYAKSKLKIEKIGVEDIKKDIQGIKEASIKVIEYLKNHKSSRILFYEDLFGFFSGVKLNTQKNYKNIENWQELKNFYEENKDFCHFHL